MAKNRLVMAELGDYLKQARVKRGWSLREAARRAGMAHSRLHDIEVGFSSKTRRAVVPTRENLDRISRAYGLPRDHLLALAFFPEALTDEAARSGRERELLAVFRSLTPDRQRLLVVMGEALKSLAFEQPPSGSMTR